MKLKYYLRGLGIGIIVTAVIMGVASGSRKETLSDREIKERAAALGMVEPGNSLADMQESADPEQEEEPVSAQNAEPTEMPSEAPAKAPVAEPTEMPTETPAKAPAAEPTEVPTETPAKAPVAEPTEVPTEAPGKTPVAELPDVTPSKNAFTAGSEEQITIEIKSGEDSSAICRKLEQAGLIASASDFDVYLYSHGYDRKLRIGSYEIPAGAEPETIAKILTHEQ